MLIPEKFKDMTLEEKDEAFEELMKYSKKVNNEHLKRVCIEILKDNKDKLYTRPAGHNSLMGDIAPRTHHCYEGGLMVHLLGVTRISDYLVDTYKEVSRDLVLCGALLHDIGKVAIFDKYIKCGEIHGNLNEKYLLVDHMYIGMNLVDKYIESTKTEVDKELWISERTKYQLLHIINSHMDTVTKHMAEAYIVSYADSIDAYMSNLLGYKRDAKNETSDTWIFESTTEVK